MEVEIISSEQIKPSSPTPQHLQLFKLSILDQLVLSTFAPIIFFYPKLQNTSIDTQVEILKTSLSQTLTLFYPLAGTLVDDLSILCNDVGAHFVQARVNCGLEHFLARPDLIFLNRLLPCSVFTAPTAVNHVTNVQINSFDCGAIAIGLCISHKIFDAESMVTFLKAWTSAARQCSDSVTIIPSFVSATLFPANDSLWFKDTMVSSFTPLLKNGGKFITRRFVFDGTAINRLKERAGDSNKSPSRVEVVSALLWKSTMAGWKRKSFLSHTVNLRGRMDPSSVKNSIGNSLWIAPTASTSLAKLQDFGDLVKRIRESISKIDRDFVKGLQTIGEKREGLMRESLWEIEEKGKAGDEILFFTSWCRFGYYEMDFGWGKPVWVCSTGVDDSYVLNLVVLMDTRSGDGIEAWVSLDEQDMKRLENDEELLAFASLDPSPLV